MPQVQIPNNFTARDYQIKFLKAVEDSIEGKSDIRFFIQCWHRRSGKDKTNIADVVPRRLLKDPCLVKYVYPTLVMGRDNMWDGMGSDGFRYINHIPKEIREGDANKTRMVVQTKNGSQFQIAGSDEPDSLRGGNPKMFVFSEWSEQNPYALDVVEPILRENDGIGIFNFTPKGDNHAKALIEYAKSNPQWFVQILTANDTSVFSAQQLLQIREETIKRFIAQGRSEEEGIAYFEQEYMCSFDSPVVGSYYGAALRRAEAEGRISNVSWEPQLPVHTFWDLGVGDSTAIWFMQAIGREVHLIDYYQASGEGVPHYISKLKEKPYTYGNVYWPHDGKVREFGSGMSRVETAEKYGMRPLIVANQSIEDGIEAARSMLARCWFDAKKCDLGIKALKNYHKDWDDKNQVFRDKPKHDWSSHGSDAFRYLAIGFRDDLDDAGYVSPPSVLSRNEPIIINNTPLSPSLDRILNRNQEDDMSWMQ